LSGLPALASRRSGGEPALFLVGLSEEVAAQELKALIEDLRTQDVLSPAEREGLLRWAENA